jgi:thiazole synthase ThiGH ThiG subunit
MAGMLVFNIRSKTPEPQSSLVPDGIYRSLSPRVNGPRREAETYLITVEVNNNCIISRLKSIHIWQYERRKKYLLASNTSGAQTARA